ncbi:hypothetical protein [Actinacidiphila glaucinigra]|uniref:hypothetical protein n=1 Tax=Actinacidiphila glaucinigra TaxID=235986 RepID=UPI00367303E7
MSRWYERLEAAELLHGTPERPSRIDEIARFTDAVYTARNDETEVDEFQDYPLHPVPQQEGESLFCSAVPRGDGAAALMYGPCRRSRFTPSAQAGRSVNSSSSRSISALVITVPLPVMGGRMCARP